MRILLVTQYFYPEVFKSNDLAFELAKRGHHVDALVGIPNYPEGEYFKGYGLFSKRHQIVNGVNVYRCFQTPRGKGGWRLPINYLSYVISGCLWVLFFFAWKKKYDCIIGHEPSPIFQAYPALLLRKLRKIPFYYWIMDLWPDAMKSGGGVKNERILNWVDHLVKDIYRQTDKILITSKRFRESIEQKGDFKDKIIYFPNWSDDILEMSTDYEIPQLPDGFKIMIAGNLGKSQNLEAVAEVMLGLKGIPEIKWIFVGGGSRKEWLESFIKENRMEGNAVCLGQYPFKAMPAFFKHADAMLVTLGAGFPHLEAVVPARLQSYMSAGCPVLAMIGCGGADIITESNCGYTVPAGDSQSLIKIIKEKVLNHRDDFAQMGQNGRDYYMKNYRMDMCIDNLEKIIGAK
ncbi:glycosyltransferase family 4 protein [Bacteroides heparinolyticus]|uniref:Putative LPS biosynthesis glycosyltransferase n=1 Tax=Prevotella heparinolytica TaxID=28113 RepID=A0A449I7S7_9BACE|nr:glycosyltransferase family 4 protein [Bacteroides heparinolyticus]MCI6213144.1 glycosyltransferase family 4 protein [Bacteroides heparinolyticus]VFB15478.1 putative LPS biosynthesis glycosyltransferase [Bacteroides heparinolyticus]